MKMNKYVKEFLHRGLMFSGLGPIIYGIIALTTPSAMSDGRAVFVAIVSTYLLAFIQAGTSVFHTVESWSAVKRRVDGSCRESQRCQTKRGPDALGVPDFNVLLRISYTPILEF